MDIQGMEKQGDEASIPTIIIGGGQAGLAAGYYLSQYQENFIILDANQRTGDSWRQRWDGLRLFTPSQFNSLPGKPFPHPVNYLPAKDEVADYMEDYVRQFDLPVRHGLKVESLSHNARGFEISTESSKIHANNVIIATGPFQVPYIPALATQLNQSIFQLHSSAYRNAQQVPAQSVLIVGAGNSGAEIALELIKAGKQVWLSGRDVGRIPTNSPLGKAFHGRLMWWFMSNVMNVKTPIGRRMQSNGLKHGTPLGRAKRQEVAEAGVRLVPRLTGVQSGKPRIEDGRLLDVEGVIWATGFQPDYRWINLPIFDEHGWPLHKQGIVVTEPDLYFLGLFFQTALTSSLLGGVGKDADFIVRKITEKGYSD